MYIVKPNYYDDFQCIGAECPETCCQQWSIIFSRSDYVDLKNSPCSKELEAIIDSSFVKINGGNDVNYALIKFDEKGICPMLKDGLCRIQSELGEKALSYTCSVFPRLQTLVGEDTYICACSLTCPRTVELLMEHSEGIKFSRRGYNGRNEFLNKGLFSLRKISEDWEGFHCYRDIKTAEIAILQNRDFSISERLLVLGFFCQKAKEYIDKKEGKKVSSLAAELSQSEMCKKIAASLYPNQSREQEAARSIELLGKISLFVSGEAAVSSKVKGLLQQVVDSLELNIETAGDNSLLFNWSDEKYFKSMSLYRAVEKGADFLIENILVNIAFTASTPEGIWANYFTMAVFYNMLRISLPAFLSEDWGDRDLAAAVAKTAKMVLNSGIVKKKVMVDYLERGEFDLAHTVFLVG